MTFSDIKMFTTEKEVDCKLQLESAMLTAEMHTRKVSRFVKQFCGIFSSLQANVVHTVTKWLEQRGTAAGMDITG